MKARDAGEPAPRSVGAPAIRFLVATGLFGYGDFLTTIALMVELFRLTGSALAPAGYMVARVVPRFGGPMVGGWLADRYTPQTVLAVTWLFRGAASGALVVAVVGREQAAIYALVAVGQLVGAAGRPCEGAIMPRVAAAEQLVNGLLITDAVTFVLGAALLRTLTGLGTPPDDGGARPRPPGPLATVRQPAATPLCVA